MFEALSSIKFLSRMAHIYFYRHFNLITNKRCCKIHLHLICKLTYSLLKTKKLILILSQCLDWVYSSEPSKGITQISVHSDIFVQYSFTFFPSLITGRLFDLGYFKIPLFVASTLLIVATFLTAQCKEYWQFVLCQGIVIGVSNHATPLRSSIELCTYYNMSSAIIRCHIRTYGCGDFALV